MNGLEDMQKLGKENMDLAMQSFGTMSKNMQAIAVEVADYQKKSFEEGSAALEKMMSAKSIDKAMEVQTEYLKTAYEGMVGQMTKMGEIFTDMSKEAYKPLEGMVAKAGK
ncbi:MAG: phasin family protein [Pseudomonadota bacterium]